MKLTELEKREISTYISRNDFYSYLDNKTVLITGAKGLIGSGLIKWILLQNEMKGVKTKVYASTRNPEYIPEYI